MSELKSHNAKYEQVLGEVYLKSEADRYISELIADQQLELDEWYSKVEHNKYKRCLAMSWWCSAELGMLVSTWESKIKYYKRWHKRWLELAEKFKEAK